MDLPLVQRADGPVVVSALAGEVGHDYRTASANGVRYYRALGAAEVVAAPDVRQDKDAALAVLRTARLLVLPGGSPSRLLEALMTTDVGEVVRELLAAGGTVVGSSAGAMALCPWMVLPDRRGLRGMDVAEGLGVVPDLLVVPHWSGTSRGDWLQAVRDRVPQHVQVLGLPEESGVVVDGALLTAVGRSASRLVSADTDLPVGDTWSAA